MSFSVIVLEHEGETGLKGWRADEANNYMASLGLETRYEHREFAHIVAQEHKNWLTPFGHPRVICVVTVHPKKVF